MEISLQELKRIKHALPVGAITRIANDLNIEEQIVRDFFVGRQPKNRKEIVEFHRDDKSHNSGLVHFEDISILSIALQIIEESSMTDKKLLLTRHIDRIMKEDDELLQKLA